MSFDNLTEMLCVLAPFLLTAPAFFLGKKYLFKNAGIKGLLATIPGKVFTMIVFTLHAAIMIGLFFIFVL